MPQSPSCHDHDTFAAPKAYRRRRDMELTVIKNGPHSIAWKHADQVTKEILDFLP
jgi:hypothetical protein